MTSITVVYTDYIRAMNAQRTQFETFVQCFKVNQHGVLFVPDETSQFVIDVCKDLFNCEERSFAPHTLLTDTKHHRALVFPVGDVKANSEVALKRYDEIMSVQTDIFNAINNAVSSSKTTGIALCRWSHFIVTSKVSAFHLKTYNKFPSWQAAMNIFAPIAKEVFAKHGIVINNVEGNTEYQVVTWK